VNERSAEILVSPGEARNGYGKYEIPVRRDETLTKITRIRSWSGEPTTCRSSI
jgi:hypothetical protein